MMNGGITPTPAIDPDEFNAAYDRLFSGIGVYESFDVWVEGERQRGTDLSVVISVAAHGCAALFAALIATRLPPEQFAEAVDIYTDAATEIEGSARETIEAVGPAVNDDESESEKPN